MKPSDKRPSYVSVRARTSSRALGSKRHIPGRLKPVHLAFEPLEDRTLLDATPAMVNAFKAASSAVQTIGSNLASGPLGVDLPIISGGAAALDSILGVSSTFSQISGAVNGVVPATVLGKSTQADQQAELQSELQAALGSGITVTEYDSNAILVTYTRGIGGPVNNLNLTTTAADFFGGASAETFLTDLTGLSATANGSLAGGGNFSVTFGVDSGGSFLVKSGTLVANPELQVSFGSLSADALKITNDVFDVSLSGGTATLDLKGLSLGLSADVHGTSLGSAASFSVNAGASSASFGGDFTLKVLGQDLVTWHPTLSWSFSGTGGQVSGAPHLTIPSSGAGAPSLDGGAESAVRDALTGGLGHSLGLDQLGLTLGPLASVAGSLGDFISVISDALGDGVDNGGLDPQSLLNGLDGLGANFQFPNATQLLQLVEGQSGVSVVTYDAKIDNLGPDISFNPHFPLGVISLLGIINLVPELGVSFHASGSGELDFGIDTSGGVFIDTTKTNLTYTTGLGADFHMDVNVLGAFDDAAFAQVGPGVSASFIVSLNPNNATQDKLYLSTAASSLNLNQSDPLPALGTWLADQVHLKVHFAGTIDLQVGANIGAAAIVNDIPDGPAKDFILGVEGLGQYVYDFINKVADTVCDIVDVVPIIGPAFESLVDCHDVARYTSVLFGDLQPAIQALANALDATYSEPNGIGSFKLEWMFPVTAADIDLTGASNIAPPQAATADQSQPSDYINYSLVNGVLTVTGRDGPDDIQILDAGNGKITLKRSGQEPNNGPSHTDPDVTLSGVTSIVASLGDGNDTFTMDQSLNIPATVHGGGGDDQITTGAAADSIFGDDGNDTIHAGAGHDTIDGGTGDDTIFGEDDDDTIFGGDGNDIIDGGAGDDTIHGEGGDDTIDGGDDNDTIYGDAGNDTLNGDAGNDTLWSGSGSNTLNGGDGDDKLFSQSGSNDTNLLNGGAGADELHAGSGPDVLHGDADNDTLIGGSGAASLYGDDGNDLIYGGVPHSVINGVVVGGSAASYRDGGPGDDVIKAATGDDVLVGGDGNDVLVFDNANLPDGSGVTRPPILVSATAGGAAVYGGDFGSDTGQAGDILALGAGGSDSLNETYTVGAVNESGSIVTTDGTIAQKIQFHGIPSTVDSVPVHSLTVNAGLPGDTQNNTITIGDVNDTVPGPDDDDDTDLPPNVTLTQVAISDRQNAIAFGNKPTVTVNALGGNDNVSLDITVPGSGLNHMIVDGGDATDTFSAVYRTDFGGVLDVKNFENIPSIAVQGNLSGQITAATPGNVTSFSVGQSITQTGQFQADSIGTATIGQDIAGKVLVSQGIGSMTVGGSLTSSGQVSAGGSIGALAINQDLAGTMSAGGDVTTATVGRDISGTLHAGGSIHNLSLGRSLTNTGVVSTGQNLDSMTVGGDLAGQLIVGVLLSTLRVTGGTPGTITAGHVGTIGALGGYGPVVLQVNEGGTQRRVEAAVPSVPYPVPPPPPAPTPPISPSAPRFTYFYESGALANPQLTLRVSNTSPSIDQFDLSLVTYNDARKFNLARLDATGASGIRNVAVEGDVLSAVTAAASAYLGSPSPLAAGIHLPQDKLAAVAVRDFIPNQSIQAASIQAVAFGSTTRKDSQTETGSVANGNDAANLLAPSTAIVQAGSSNGMAEETFRVPFADLATQQVGFFMDDSPGGGQGHFDNNNVVLVVQGVSTANSSGTDNNVTPSNVARGAVIALITVAETFNQNNQLQNSVIQTIGLRGDGGSIVTQQTIGSSNNNSQTKVPFTPSITSTGPLGDVIIQGPLPNVTAPSIFGSLLPGGPIPATSTVQTTGLRTDPITGAVSQVPADLGRVYVVQTPQGPVVTTTLVQSNGPGLAGQIICGGNLISQVVSNGPTTGTILVQPVAWEPGAGNLGTTFTYPSGQVLYLGGFISNGPMLAPTVSTSDSSGTTNVNGLLQGGTITTYGSVIGNITIGGPMNGPAVSTGNNNTVLNLNGTLQGGFITTYGSVIGNIAINGPMNGPTLSAGNNNTVVNLNGTLQGGFITTYGSVIGNITIGGPMNGPTVSAGNNGTVVNVNGPVQGGSITTYGSATGTITINGPVNAPTVSAGNNGGTIKLNAPAQGGSILTGGTLGNLTIGGPLSGQVVTIGNMNGTVKINGAVQGGVIATSGSINGNLTIGGPLSNGQILSVGNINGNVTIQGPLQSGRIAALGSILGNLTISGSIDSKSALVSGGSIGNPATGTGLSVGNVNGIVAAVGPINVIRIGSTNTALYYQQNDTMDAAVIDAIFSQGVSPLSSSDLFDETTPLDLQNLGVILDNLNSLSVKNGRLQL